MTVFRAITARFAQDGSDSPEEMYDNPDKMIRFRTSRSKDRRSKYKKEPELLLFYMRARVL